ncbi:MAG TPA: IS5 family transposase [Syntrophales bacterium]|jgi:IS5 family transposase|nr:IS5 family transposase [Syntrophales bacterium]
MSFKKTSRLSFADLALFNSMNRNRAIQRMEQINNTVNWSRIERLVIRNYPVGKSAEGNDAYHPLLLLKCLLLQQWFRIDSDPELETQINDRISFKKFLGIPMDENAPDHSTFSRFRSRLSKEIMKAVNHELLSQFAARGLSINEGIAVDARLVQSASRPLGEDKLAEERSKREALEGCLDKSGKPMKFSRDLDSDWTVRNNVPHFGLKEHAAVDTRYGFVLATEMTPASLHDSPLLPLCVAGSCHTPNPIQKVFADKGYFGKSNREFLRLNNIQDGIMRKATRGAKLTAYEKERNKAIAKVRYIVEQYFGISHLYHHAHRARFTKLIKNAIDALFRQLAFNLSRGTKVLASQRQWCPI